MTPPANERPGPPAGEKQREAIVTQDIMLIPRMVYVPYAPQVPVAPARLGTVTPGARVVQQEEDTTPRAGPAPKDVTPRDVDTKEKQVCDALDKCCKKMDEMCQRITIIEAKTQCLPGPAPACPNPGRPGLFHRSNP